MKLTLTQIMMLAEACRDAAKVYDQRQAAEPTPVMQDYWKGEAEQSRELETILRQAVGVQVEVIETKVQATDASEGDLPPSSSPTDLPSPSPRALRIANTLSKLSLRMLLGFPPVPARVLASRCNTILNSRGEAEPLDARDLQAAARHLWRQKGYTPHLPQQSQAPEGCLEAQAGTLAAPAHSGVPAQHPTAESMPHKSCADPSSAQPAHKAALEAWHSSTSSSLPVS